MSSIPTVVDLENESIFPPFHNLPSEYLRKASKSHWCFLAEIHEIVPYVRPMYTVKDKTGAERLVVFYLDNGTPTPTAVKKSRETYTMCIMDAVKHQFMDGQVGIRVEDEKSVKILPCTLQQLFNIRDNIVNLQGVCNVCCGPSSLKCSKCKISYCGKTCQLNDWNGWHKVECKVAQQLSEWGAFDWDS
ncbi:MYND-type domain-containing protein [Favolaschia claudopus]|uniref:MYND-type domain-containing protein n=1 Tax=Favolaschia claudopus TaxID=2862362 RepID=A0AAW0EDZ9_9AGAR